MDRLPMCFVLMPFAAPFNRYYQTIYRPAIKAVGLEPKRADEIFNPGPFMRDVVTGIIESSVVLAELTGRNANVFYELGICHAFEKTAVLVTQTEADIPSDLRALKIITYDKDDPDWGTKLKAKVSSALRTVTDENSPSQFTLPGAGNQVSFRIAQALASLSPMQKQIFDRIRSADTGVDQDTLRGEFDSMSLGELYYRLQALRLGGLIYSLTGDSSGGSSLTTDSSGRRPQFYRVSREAKALSDPTLKTPSGKG